jgi:hypothetical protein
MNAWVAELETTHYSWRAFGTTEKGAVAALRKGWNVHRKLSGAGPFSEFEDGVRTWEVKPGECWCDGIRMAP